jgi:suppressor of ftsI
LRRSAILALAALLLVLSGCGGGGRHLARNGCIPHPPPMIEDGFPEPRVLVSTNGVLETTLTASYSPVTINGTKLRTLNYEGAFPGPTLVVCPGDRLIVHLVNNLGAAPTEWGPTPPMHHMHMTHDMGQLTNLHVHGLHVSPSGNSDNVFVSFGPGQSFTYAYRLPDNHPPGLNWYHPHRHGFVEQQIYAGLYGALDVQGGLDTLPEIRDIPTRLLTIASLQLGDEKAWSGAVVPTAKSLTEKSPYFVNGELDPEIDIRPGEVQRWQILNANDNAIVRISMRGHTFYVLANDGNTLGRISPQQRLLIGPGQRREVLVQGGRAGTYDLVSEAFRQFKGEGNYVPASTIATLHSDGATQHDRLPEARLAKLEDLRAERVDQRHRLVFTERKNKAQGGYDFLGNGKVFDPNRVDEVMTLGEVNEWALVNKTTEWHTFHIHVNDFQVVYVDAKPVRNVSSGPEGVEDVALGENNPSDTVLMPPHSTVKILTRPTDFAGTFVFHCHMTFHEDHGMMGVVKVVAPA